MIDIHTHILPGIDDGARTLDESVTIVKNASKNGVTDIIVTPHFILGSQYNANNNSKRKLLNQLKKELEKENIKVNLFLGNEVFIESDLLKLKKSRFISTLNNSHYLLFELPMSGEYNGLDDVIFNLDCSSYISVLAHPERYTAFKKNPRLIEKVVAKGALLQCNLGSFLGRYGKEAQKLAFLLIKHHAVSFIASDIHRGESDSYEQIENVKSLLKKYISDEEIQDLFVTNAQRIINNEEPVRTSMVPFKKSFLGKWS